jgi:hypothetical protein
MIYVILLDNYSTIYNYGKKKGRVYLKKLETTVSHQAGFPAGLKCNDQPQLPERS